MARDITIQQDLCRVKEHIQGVQTLSVKSNLLILPIQS